MSEFITDAAAAAAWRDELDRAGKKLVFTNGCFDVLHVGHVRYLREARALGDAMLVAVNADASVRELKGPGRPINNAADRAEVLCGLESVDKVVVFEEKRVTGLIESIRPHIYAKGGDYAVDELPREEVAAAETAGSDIRILSLVPGKSTTDTLAKLRGDRKLRIAVLGSGNGSNFEAIAEAVEKQQLLAEIRLVISDVADAQILERARGRGIPAMHLESEAEIVEQLRRAEVDLVALAGFMRIVKTPMLEAFPERILNVHPSLLPDFPGLNAPKQAIEAGAAETGCTVHVVDAEIDRGPILGQARVPIEAGDTPEILHQRIKIEEHRLFPKIIGEYGARFVQ